MTINKKPLEIIFWDVQHGNAIFIRTPNNTLIVQDLGIGDCSQNLSDFSPLSHLRLRYKIKNLDEVIITHPDLDHIEDILNLGLFDIKCISYPSTITTQDIMEKINKSENSYQENIFYGYLNFLEKFKGTVPDYNNPNFPHNNGGVKIKIYYSTPYIENHKENNHSLVTIISYAGFKVILTGDNESASWQYLLNNNSFKNDIRETDIFLASHHGRESGYYDDLFNYFSPKLTIISDGPVKNTSITDKYFNHTTGWNVLDQYGYEKKRYCLTTRNDGAICVRIGFNSWNNSFMNVKIQY